jgi:hypothetical protein
MLSASYTVIYGSLNNADFDNRIDTCSCESNLAEGRCRIGFSALIASPRKQVLLIRQECVEALEMPLEKELMWRATA